MLDSTERGSPSNSTPPAFTVVSRRFPGAGSALALTGMNLDYKLDQLQRLLVCGRLYGWRNALRMVLRLGSTDAERTIVLPGGLPFSFRGRVDVGVVSHFSIEGYFIDDSAGRPIRTIIDGGANIGDETARFYLHHPEAQIVAVEAEQENFRMLEKNFGEVSRVRLIHGGLWSSDGDLRVVPAASGNREAFRVDMAPPGHGDIKASSIPAIMEMMQWREIDILKLDIEGAEHELFTRNFEPWIDRVNVFIFEIPDADHPGTTQEIFRALGDRVFDTYFCGENLILIKRGIPWRLQRVFGVSNDRIAAIGRG